VSYYPRNKPQTGYWGPTSGRYADLRRGLLAWLPFDEPGSVFNFRDALSHERSQLVLGAGGGGAGFLTAGQRGVSLRLSYAQSGTNGGVLKWLGSLANGTYGAWTASVAIQVSALSTSNHKKSIFVLPGSTSIDMAYNPSIKQFRLTSGGVQLNSTLTPAQHTKITTEMVLLTGTRNLGGLAATYINDELTGFAGGVGASSVTGTIGIPWNAAGKSQLLLSCNIYAFYFWNRSLQIDDIRLMSRDPFALYRGIENFRSTAVISDTIGFPYGVPGLDPAVSGLTELGPAIASTSAGAWAVDGDQDSEPAVACKTGAGQAVSGESRLRVPHH